jgi:DNA mismatch repair protein MutL
MSQDDAILAFEHHATSKLKNDDDLNAIGTLGFRGEALPSIASVSRLTLKTRPTDSNTISGSEIEIQGGVMRSVKPVPWDKGTEITIRDLFYNIPARRKFLRSNDTELGHIARLVTHYALVHPEIRFTLESEGRILTDAIAVSNTKERIYQIFGDGFLDNMAELSGQNASVKVHGFTSRPHEQRTNPYSQFLYVNGRMIRDKVIMSAIRKAYRNCISASAYPIVILFLELPLDQVDVNAHPAKTEIRFREQSVVHDLVLNAIGTALTKSAVIPDYNHFISVQPLPSVYTPPAPGQGGIVHPSNSEVFDFTPPAASPDPFQRALNYPFRDVPASAFPKREDHFGLRIAPEMLFGSPHEATRPFQSGTVRIMGQLQDSYIIACDSQGLLIIDQHVAHERVLYEKLAETMLDNVVETQGLLVPLSLELPPHQLALMDKVMPDLSRNGFQVEHFGGSSILVRTVPAIAGDSDCRQLLAEILEGLETEERALDAARIRDKIAVSTACRAAIKVNMPLTFEKMQWLLDQLALTRIPTNCPHGRPIILRFSMYEIERNFGRI